MKKTLLFFILCSFIKLIGSDLTFTDTEIQRNQQNYIDVIEKNLKKTTLIHDDTIKSIRSDIDSINKKCQRTPQDFKVNRKNTIDQIESLKTTFENLNQQILKNQLEDLNKFLKIECYLKQFNATIGALLIESEKNSNIKPTVEALVQKYTIILNDSDSKNSRVEELEKNITQLKKRQNLMVLSSTVTWISIGIICAFKFLRK